MRTVKYIGWHKPTGKIIDLHKITPLALSAGMTGDGIYLPFSEEIILMQFIDIKDSNNIDIYQDYIVRCIGGEEHQGYHEYDIIGVVTFSYGSFSVVTKDNVHYDFALANWDTITIIGNIYQNPDLLK